MIVDIQDAEVIGGSIPNKQLKLLLGWAVFACLKPMSIFRRVYIDDCGCVAWDKDPTVDSNVVWNNKIDLCPDSCYLDSKRVDM